MPGSAGSLAMDGVTNVPVPANEPVRMYPPGSPDRAAVEGKVKELAGEHAELTMTIGGRRRLGGGEPVDVVAPHNHRHVLGTLRNATREDVAAAIDAAAAAAPAWRALSFDDRAAIMLKAADLLSGPWRATINTATILGQSKSVYQAEIDAACEMIDFWRFNVHYARRLLAEQPESGPGTWNRMEYRPLEGFVLAITPFNFTSIAGDLAGIHFTGSTGTFQHLWRTVGENVATYRGYPRLVGETGGKDFVIAHPSADPAVLATALVRGAYEYQGQKCSAASRAYVPRSVWQGMRDDFLAQVESLTMGDVAADLSLFMGAVIDERAFAKHAGALEGARGRPSVRVLTGGQTDDSEGYFVQPTVLECSDPADEVFTTEYFGPILAVHVYDDARYDEVLAQAADVARYALTGSVIAQDRAAIAEATEKMRFS